MIGYYQVGGDQSQVWSTMAHAYVPESDATFQAWLAAGGLVGRMPTEIELSEYLAQFGEAGPVVRQADVIAERERRLAMGVDYDFVDARGVHHIGTTPQDMIGWDEVSKLAQAAINLGAGSTPINLVTDTGPVVVTAIEWQQILVAAGQARQPIWAASFVLQEMSPIPDDFKSDGYWGM